MESLSRRVIRHQVFGVDLVELMEKQNKSLGCPELRVPRFIFQIVKQLDTNGLTQIGMFRVSGNKKNIQILEDALDAGTSILLPSSELLQGIV